MTMRRQRAIFAAAALVTMLAGCTSTTAGTPQATSSASAVSSASTTHPSHAATTTRAHTSPPPTSASESAAQQTLRVFNAMTEAQRVGQLLMVDCSSTGVSQATLDAISDDGAGSVILDGTSYASLTATATITARLQRAAPAGVGLFVATDQEGGLVQRLRGAGFSSVPSALEQGAESPASLRADAAQWGAELRRAGVNVDLAPVLDIVPVGWGSNPPIGDLDREFGHTAATVTSHGLAVVAGLAQAGVDATVKHFPGLGRTRGNTDLSTGVQDTVTVRHDPYLAPFAAAVDAGAPLVMMSTAIYSKIDSARPAAFSPTIVTGMLRGDLGFHGVVISDDLGVAKQVSGYSVGARAVAFIEAGGDIVLTVDASLAATMTAAILARTRTDPAFKAQVNSAAFRVLQAKQARGLLH